MIDAAPALCDVIARCCRRQPCLMPLPADYADAAVDAMSHFAFDAVRDAAADATPLLMLLMIFSDAADFAIAADVDSIAAISSRVSLICHRRRRVFICRRRGEFAARYCLRAR